LVQFSQEMNNLT